MPSVEKNRRKGSAGTLYEWVQALVCSALAVVLLFTFFIRIMRVDGPSMRETLQNGDGMAVVNACWCRDFRPGDVIIVGDRSFRDGKPIVKRVIAVAGQTVDIDFAAGGVYVDGKLLVEPYRREPTYLNEGTAFPLTVPANCVFVMGDNRNDSDDSRDPELGPVDLRSVIGRAVFLTFPGRSADTGTRSFSRIGTIG